MSESFDTPPTAAEAQAAGFDTPPTAAEQGFESPPTAEETAPLNVGVTPMPSRETQLAALRAAPTGQDAAPGAYTLGGPSATAFQATARGLTGQQAGEALQLSKATGFSPDFAADNAADLRTQTDRAAMTRALAGAPALASYAAKGSVQASAVKESVGPLAALEQGLMDLGYQVAAEREFESPGSESAGLAMSEGETAAYDKKESPWYADLLRSVPTLATYYLLGAGGKMIGGKAGEFSATAGAMFMLNRGTLYRQIMREMPIPASDQEGIIGQGIYDQDAYEQRARTYATAGAGASAALGAGLSTAIGMMFPGAAQRAASLSNGLIARAFTDAATRDIVQRLAQAGGHTLSGALMMAIPAVVDDATVQEAVRGHVDPGKASAAGWEAFKKSLLAAGALSALPHVVPIVRDIGRINRAGEDAARLQSHVDQANKADLPPDEKRDVIGRMVAQSDVPQVHVDPEHLTPEMTQKLVETLADEGRSLAEAKALGTEVPVPTEKYLTDLADQHETLKQDVKLDPDGLTPRQTDEVKAGVQAQTDTIGSLMAARDYALRTEPESPERIAKLQDLETRMRSVAARGQGMPDTGKGTPEEVAAEMVKLDTELANRPGEPALQPEQAQALRAALEPKAPEQAPIPAPELEEHAAQAVEGKTIGELQPGRYELAARTASDRIYKVQTQTVERLATAEQTAQEGLRAAVGAATGLTGTTATKVITPQNMAGEPATYRLVEASKLVTSHTPTSFEPDPRYPANVQERDYRTELGEQAKVARGGRFLDPALVLAETPTAVDGPPLVTSGGKSIVLGGNGRSMMLLRAYEEAGESAQRYREELRKNAPRYGIDPRDVDAMRQPVLVRSIDELRGDAPKQDLVAAVRRYNEGLTQHLSPRIRAVAEARVLSERTVSAIGELLGSGDASLRDVLRSRPQDFLSILERDGVVTAQNRAEWTAGGELTDEAKDRIEGMFLGRVMGSGERLQATAPSVSNKVERAVPALLRVEGVNPAQSEIGDVQGAVDLLNEAKRREMSLDDLLAQQTMFKEGRVPKRTVAVARLLEQGTPKEVGQRFKAWADAAAVDPRQGGMFGGAATPADALGKLFEGLDVDFSGKSRPADSAPEPTAKKGTQPAATRTPGATPIMSDVQAAQDASVRATRETVKAGDRMADVQRLVGARDLARAMAKKVGEVRAEMDGIRDRITDRFNDDKVRADLNLADPAYRAAADSLLGQLGLAPEVLGAQGIDGAVAKMSGDARLLGFDAEAIKDIFASGRDWKSLTPPESRNVQDALTSIREAAKAEHEIALVDRKMDLRAFVSSIGEHLFGGRGGGPPEKVLPPPSDAGEGRIERAQTALGKLGGELLQPREILRRLGPGGDAIYDLFVRSRNYKEELSRQVGKILNDAWRELPKEMQKGRAGPVDGPGSPLVDNKWTRQDLWMLSAWYGSESGAERLRNGLQVTDEQVLHALSQLTPEEAQFIDKMHGLNDDHLWPLVRDHEMRRTGTAPPKIQARPFTVTLADGEAHTFRGGYWPAKNGGDFVPPAADTVAGYWGTLRDGFPATSKTFTKERAASANYVPDLKWQSYGNHLNSVLHYLAFDDFVGEAGRLMRDKEFRQIVGQGLGEQEVSELDKFVQVSARGNVEAAKGGAEYWNRFVGGGFRGLMAAAAFRLNLPVVAGQLSHIPATMSGLGIGPLDMAKGVGKAFLPGSWAEAHAQSEQLPYRWNGYGAHMREMLNNIGATGERSTWTRAMDVASWIPYHLMDGLLSKSIWEAARSKAEGQGAGLAEQVRAADAAVATMMPPLNIAEQSSIARDRGVIGSLLLVRNFPNTLYNVGAMRAWEARNSIVSSSPGWQRAVQSLGAPTIAAASYLGMVWSAHIFGRFLMGHGRQEDETTPQWLERDAIAAPFYPIPIVSEVADPLSKALTSRESFSQALLHGHADVQSAPLLAFMQLIIRNLGQAADHGKGAVDRVFAGLRLGGAVAGAGAWPLKPIRYGIDLQTGKVRPRGPFDVMGGFSYGQRPKQERNPFTTAQDIESGRLR